MLPKILTRLIVNQHCSVGERGMIGFDLGNWCQCSKTFGRHCLKIFSKTAICDIKTLSYPRVFDGADLTAANENSKFLFFTHVKWGEGLGLWTIVIVDIRALLFVTKKHSTDFFRQYHLNHYWVQVFCAEFDHQFKKTIIFKGNTVEFIALEKVFFFAGKSPYLWFNCWWKNKNIHENVYKPCMI